MTELKKIVTVQDVLYSIDFKDILKTRQSNTHQDREVERDGIWLICTAGFITSSINYRVEERTGKNPIHIYLQPKPFSSEKWKKKKKILVKNTSEHLKEEVGTIISITSEDKCKIFCTFVTTTLLCSQEGTTTWMGFIS